MNQNKMGSWLLPIFCLTFLLNQVQSDVAIAMPNTNDIKSVTKFASFVQYYMDNSYKLDDSSQSNSNRMSDLSKMYSDMTSLLFRSEAIIEKSFDDYLKIFLEKCSQYQLDNNSLIETTSNSLHIIKYRFKVVGNFAKSLTNTYGKLNNVTYWCTFANNAWQYLSQPFSVTLNDLFFDITSSIADQLQEYNSQKHICNSKISLQRELYLLIKTLMEKHIQEYILSTYTWALKYKCSESNIKQVMWKNTNTKIKQKFLKDFQKCIQLSSKILNKLPRDIYQCEFKEYVRDSTYLELKRMRQMFIANEYDLNKDDTCRYNCKFPEKSLASNYQNDDTQCEEILDCKILSSPLEVCALHHQPRRLEWFQDAKGVVYGSNSTSVCSGEKKTLLTSSWWLHSCDHCICTCKGQKSSNNSNLITTTINFRDQTSDINNNMVVVGIRFVHQNNMIHVQIKEGKILPRGKIDKRTLAWKAVENIIYDNQGNEPMILQDNNLNTSLINGSDYGYLSSIDLGDIIAPKNYLVTGVRFKYVQNWNTTQGNTDDKPVELQIQVTLYDYYYGILSHLEQTRWISPSEFTEDNHDRKLQLISQKPITRKELVLEEPDNPIKSSENVLNSQDYQFIKFRVSDMKKDAGQSTVPFFDGQPVEGKPACPLSGVGVFHKGIKGYGGFISFRIHDINLSDYMNYYSNDIKN